MKNLLFTLSLIFLFIDPSLIQGKWKLNSYDGFINIMTSESFKSESEERQIEMANSIKFALDNTYYEFTKDSVHFTDAGANLVKEKRGRWLISGDTLIIFEAHRIKANKFFISELNSEELRINLVFPDGYVSKSSWNFIRDK